MAAVSGRGFQHQACAAARQTLRVTPAAGILDGWSTTSPQMRVGAVRVTFVKEEEVEREPAQAGAACELPRHSFLRHYCAALVVSRCTLTFMMKNTPLAKLCDSSFLTNIGMYLPFGRP
jgi:hypothetical protein